MTIKKHIEAAGDVTIRELLPMIQNRIMNHTTYFGVPTLKNPMDFWVYQEIIWSQKPDVVIEIGNNCGGSALALAHLLDNVGKGRLIAVDIRQAGIHHIVRAHPRIDLVEGDAVASFDRVSAMIEANQHVLIIEDSSHTYDNTLAVLRTYQGLLKVGDMFIIEDGICHHGLDVGPSPGPYEAIEDFVAESQAFEIDRGFENFIITWNPKGYLRRK